MLHLIKCDRYRKSSGALLCPTLYNSKATISNQEFVENGVPPWIMNNNRYSKMDDFLPIKLFTYQNIKHLREMHRLDLAFSLIPSTVLAEAVLNELYTREQRLHLLSIGFSFMFIYFIELNEYTKTPHNIQSTSKAKGNGKCVTLYEKKFCSKYLTLCSALSYQISQPECVDLGSLGSHHLEHFFGGIRRVSKGNDTAEHFVYRVYDALLKNIIKRNLSMKDTEERRVSSSGVFLEHAEEKAKSFSIITYIQLAWCFYSSFRQPGEFFNFQLFQIATIEGKDVMTEEEAFQHLEEILLFGQKEKEPKVISTKKEKIVIRSGLTNDKRNAEANQITKIKTFSETASTIMISMEQDVDDSTSNDELQNISPLTAEEIVQSMTDEIENSG